MQIKQIAHTFSLGQFESIFTYFSKDIVWNIVGEQTFIGIQAVTDHCLQIQHFFNRTEHDFKVLNEFQSDDQCVVQGIARFFQVIQQLKSMLVTFTHLIQSKGFLRLSLTVLKSVHNG